MLNSFGLTLEDSTAAFRRQMGERGPHTRGLTVSPAAQLILERANLKALQLQDDPVSSEHILLAIVEKWSRNPFSAMLEARGVSAAEVQERTIAVGEGMLVQSVGASPQLRPWPDLWPSLDEVMLAPSPIGKDPVTNREWSSVMFADSEGHTFSHGQTLRQYYVDDDGYPVLTTTGAPVHLMLDDDGQPIRDPQGRGIVTQVEVPLGCGVNRLT